MHVDVPIEHILERAAKQAAEAAAERVAQLLADRHTISVDAAHRVVVAIRDRWDCDEHPEVHAACKQILSALAYHFDPDAIEPALLMPIDRLDLSVRTDNSLTMLAVKSVLDLVVWEECDLLKHRVSRRCVNEIKKKLVPLRLTLGMGSDPSVQRLLQRSAGSTP